MRVLKKLLPYLSHFSSQYLCSLVHIVASWLSRMHMTCDLSQSISHDNVPDTLSISECLVTHDDASDTLYLTRQCTWHIVHHRVSCDRMSISECISHRSYQRCGCSTQILDTQIVVTLVCILVTLVCILVTLVCVVVTLVCVVIATSSSKRL